MNKFRHGLVAVLGSISVGLSQGAISAPVTAAATIDWSQLQLEFTSLGDPESAAIFSGYNTFLNSYAAFNGTDESNSKSVNNWTSTTETNADAGSSHADALASSLSFSGNAMSSEGSASSSGSREVNFSVDGPGVLTVTVPYTLSLTGDSDCYYCYYDHATVSGNASFNSDYAGAGDAYSYSNASFSLTNDYWSSSPDYQSGTLVFGIVASDSGNGSLSVGFDLSAASVVPEPETYAMLLAGLMIIGRIANGRSRSRSTS